MRQNARDLTGVRINKARPVVPIPVGGGVVRVDVARTIVATIVHVPTAANGTHSVGINEVGVRERNPHQVHRDPKLRTV